jgi:hypothetical protein
MIRSSAARPRYFKFWSRSSTNERSFVTKKAKSRDPPQAASCHDEPPYVTIVPRRHHSSSLGCSSLAMIGSKTSSACTCTISSGRFRHSRDPLTSGAAVRHQQGISSSVGSRDHRKEKRRMSRAVSGSTRSRTHATRGRPSGQRNDGELRTASQRRRRRREGREAELPARLQAPASPRGAPRLHRRPAAAGTRGRASLHPASASLCSALHSSQMYGAHGLTVVQSRLCDRSAAFDAGVRPSPPAGSSPSSTAQIVAASASVTASLTTPRAPRVRAQALHVRLCD